MDSNKTGCQTHWHGKRAADLLRKEVLHDFFQLWRSCERNQTVARQKRLCTLMAQCQLQTIRATAAYRQQVRTDCADRARTLFFEAKGKGPEVTCAASPTPDAVTSRCPHNPALLTKGRQHPTLCLSSASILPLMKMAISALILLNSCPVRVN